MAVVATGMIAIAVLSAATVWISIEARPPLDDVELAIRLFHGVDLFLIGAVLVLAAIGWVNLLDSRLDLALFVLFTLGAAAQVYQLRRRRSVDAQPPPGSGLP